MHRHKENETDGETEENTVIDEDQQVAEYRECMATG